MKVTALAGILLQPQLACLRMQSGVSRGRSEGLPPPVSSGSRQQQLVETAESPFWTAKVSNSSVRRWSPARPTVVLDTLWRFAAERYAVYLKRLRGENPPWTSDPIIQRYRFTNAFRAADRVSQFLIRRVIYSGDWPAEDLFFRIILFKLFNRIDTWQWFESNLDVVGWTTYDRPRYEKLLSERSASGHSLYSPAYIMPAASRGAGQRKFVTHLALLESMMAERVPAALARAPRMQDVYERLMSFPGIGSFLAYQLATDLNYSELTDFSESEFVVPGPGARDGLRKCFPGTGGLTEIELIYLLYERQEEEFVRGGFPPVSLFGRPLQLIDCQNLLCEVDKYARVAHPNVRGRSHRRRIKRKFKPTAALPEPYFPPKWRLDTSTVVRLAEYARV